MLIEKIYQDMMQARKDNNAVAKNLLVTLYSEASMVGKNKRNGPSTDEEVVAVVKKFLNNSAEFISLMESRGMSAEIQHQESAILNLYIPQQMDREALQKAVEDVILSSGIKTPDPKSMGVVMAKLKELFNGQYDGKMASEVVKSALI